MDETKAFLSSNTTSEEQITWDQLEQLGLALTYRQEPLSGWSYRWRGESWEGLYQTRMAALAAAFSTAIDCLILSNSCPFPRGSCPLLKPPPRQILFEGEWGKDEDEKAWGYEQDQEG